MKKRLTIFAFLLLTGGMLRMAMAQVSITAYVSAEVIEALAAVESSPLNFGRFFPQEAGGMIIITPDGNRSVMGSVGLAAGPHNSGSYVLTGQDDASFSISLPSTAVPITNTESSKTMYITDWVSDPPQGIGVATLDGGSTTVSVGATLLVNGIVDNPKGVYSGTYSITFDYN